MFFKYRKDSNGSTGKLRANIAILEDQKRVDQEMYEDRIETITKDKRIQEENNIKLLYQNMELIEIINEAKLSNNLDEIKKILNNAPTSLISQKNINT